jgi:hypothetical protein
MEDCSDDADSTRQYHSSGLMVAAALDLAQFGSQLAREYLAKERKKGSITPVKTEKPAKLHEPVLDHNGKPYSPAQILALERAELTRIRVLRNSMILAERREELVETELVTRQAAAIFAACRQKLLLIPHTLSHRLVGKD